MVPQGILRKKRLLTERQEALLHELRSLLDRLADTLKRFDTNVSTDDTRALQDAIEHLDELFLLVIVGEFNSGKSSFINALLGASVLPEGVTPTTDRITLLRYGEEPTDELKEAFLLDRSYPSEVLRQLTIVDTPGTNAVIRRHEELTQTFIPRADLVLFITSSDRPFTESERVFLSMIKEWGKKIVLILNKADILEDTEVDQVVDFMRDHAQDLLGTTPEIFPVSSRRALRSRSSDNGDELWQKSRFAAMEHYIVETLDEETRIRLKLLSPLGVAEHISDTYLKAVEERLKVLHEDFNTLDNIEQQLAMFHDDLMTDVQYHLNDIDNILRELERRGLDFFDEMLRLSRTPDLLKSEHLRAAFDKEVIGDVAHQVENRIQVLIDWTVEKNLRLWQNVTDYISHQRVPHHTDGIIGEVGGAFDYNRNALLESVGRTAHNVVISYDREYEARALSEDVQSALVSTAITGVGAVGIGAGLTLLLHGALFDATGILFATVVAAGGFFILPAKRRQAKKAFSERIEEMRTQIRESVHKQFEREMHQSLSRIRDAISPYTRFVRTKREQLTDLQQEISDIDMALERLRADIEG
jgi:small GTP-binding protein